MVDGLKNGAWQGILFAELSTPWIRFLRRDMQFSHQFCVVKSIHSEFVVALFMILQWVYYTSFSTNIVTNYINAFSTNLQVWSRYVKEISHEFASEQSHPMEISAGRYEFGWGASQDVAICKEPTNHNYATTTISCALMAIVVVLGSALVVVSYYKIFS